ncbi:inactive polyglycylase TTLL10 isoform X4 [Vulpes lagopus]|uniref:inactive polyglycylase TTLL10 isoform X4 n=1 Tax=Vulpes lagopus TaxID=494514 RepID=UPI001BCA2A24|nr:inactive polyglycylase TTLL10 isoform X4 [Vulpes lagopus]
MGRGEALHVRRAWGHRLFPALPFTAAEGPATASIVPRRSPNFPERPGQLSTCTRVNLRVPFVRSPSCGRQEAGLFQEAGSPRPPPSRSEFGSWLGAGWAEAKPVHPGGSPRADSPLPSSPQSLASCACPAPLTSGPQGCCCPETVARPPLLFPRQRTHTTLLGRFTGVFLSSHQGAASCRSFYLTSWHHRGQAWQSQTDGPCRESLAWDKQDVQMALPPQGTRPHGHHRDRSQPQAEAHVQNTRRHSSPGLGPQMAQRPHRRVGVVSSQRCPCPGVPMPAARSHSRFIHRRGPPTRTHVSGKRGKRSRMAGVRQSRPRGPGWAHERPMGTIQEEQLLHSLSQLGQDAGGLGAGLRDRRASSQARASDRNPCHLATDLLDDTDVARPRTTLLERHLLEGEKQPHSTGQGPYFYIGGTNGASIISSYCKSKGWQRIQDSRREDYKLKWCEVKCRDNYYSFREGEQLLYQIPNNKLLTTKIGLLSALREYSRVVNKIHKTSLCAQAKVLKMEEFFPETYRLDIRDDREAFFTLFDENQIWICKPTASNQGKGIFLLRNQEEVAALQVKAQSIEDDPIYRKMPFRAPQARVAQRYIQNPLLLDGKKFDVRSYLLIACAMPYMVFFGHGYARLTLSLYDPHSSDLSGHLTNQFMQKKSPLYVLLKEDTVWSMDRLNRHINDKFRKTKGLPRDWVFTTFTKRMQQIMVHCFQAVKAKLHCKLGYFDLIGCDFLIDENFKVWLLEMNSNPALHTNCEVLKEVIPGVIVETLDAHKLSSPMPSGPTEERHPCRTSPLPWCLPHLISTGSLTSSACRTSTQPRTVTPLPRPLQQCPHSPPPPDLALETFQKSLRNQKMLPLLSQRRFVLLHNGETDLWPRLGGSRSALRPPPPPPPRAACEADCSAPPPTRAADRRGARRPALPRSPGGTHGPPHSEQRPRAPGLGPDGAQSGDPAPEPCARLAEEEREERRSAGHRGS